MPNRNSIQLDFSDLQGKEVVLTGASAGIGRAAAKMFLEKGARVTALARSHEKLLQLQNEARHLPGQLQPLPVDLADPKAVKEVCEQIEKVDILVSNAGYFSGSLIPQLELAEWQRHLQVNVTASFQLVQGLWPALSEAGKNHGASVVLVASLAGVNNMEKFPSTAAYVAAKSALVGLGEVVAAEGRVFNIRCNVLSPGAVDTQMLREAFPQMQADFKPEDIARSILFYSSALSAPVTGSHVVLRV